MLFALWEVITLKNAEVLVVPINGAYWLYLFSKSLPIKIERAPNGHQALYWWPRSRPQLCTESLIPGSYLTPQWQIRGDQTPKEGESRAVTDFKGDPPFPRQRALEAPLELRDWELQTRSSVGEHLGSERRWAGGALRDIIWSLTSVSSSKIHFPWRTVIKVKYGGTGFESLLCVRPNSKYFQPLNHAILSANPSQVFLSLFYMGRDWGRKGWVTHEGRPANHEQLTHEASSQWSCTSESLELKEETRAEVTTENSWGAKGPRTTTE